MKLHAISLTVVSQPLAFHRSPVTREELRDLGFEGWLLDYVQGPDAVLAMLCDTRQLHRTAYTSNPLSPVEKDAVEGSPITQYVAAREKYSIAIRREYNQRSTRVVTVGRAAFFTDAPVDVEQTRRLDNEKKEINRELGGLKERHEALTRERKILEEELKELKAQIVRALLSLFAR
jgi:hypothetical protein